MIYLWILDFNAYDLIEFIVKFFMETMSVALTSFDFEIESLEIFLRKPQVHLDTLYCHDLWEVYEWTFV